MNPLTLLKVILWKHWSSTQSRFITNVCKIRTSVLAQNEQASFELSFWLSLCLICIIRWMPVNQAIRVSGNYRFVLPSVVPIKINCSPIGQSRQLLGFYWLHTVSAARNQEFGHRGASHSRPLPDRQFWLGHRLIKSRPSSLDVNVSGSLFISSYSPFFKWIDFLWFISNS